MTQPYDLAAAFVTALGCDPMSTPLDLRALHDTDKSLPGHAQRGTLQAMWQWIVGYNEQGYGIFMTPAALDGQGRSLENVSVIRAHYVDLDNVSAQQNYEAAARHTPPPSFAVLSSPGKFHIYWALQHHVADTERFSGTQRRLRQLFDGDRAVIDAARVMRLPGTFNSKPTALSASGGAPHLVTCHALGGYGVPLTVDQLEASVAHVTVIDGGAGERHALGDPALAAPSLGWLKRAMDLVDPNELDRGEWIAFTAGVKQAGWTLAAEPELFAMWSDWCKRYDRNDDGENRKQWDSLRQTELGWPSLVRRVPSLKAAISFGEAGANPIPSPNAPSAPPMPVSEPAPLDCSGEFLTHLECEQYFKGCVFIGSMGKIMLPNGKFYNQTSFKGAYGGKKFIITQDGKTTDDAWKAATNSTLWSIPKVDHLRFLPDREPSEIITDVLGRRGVNTYVKPNIEMTPGDVTPFINHLSAIIPDAGDLRILLDWMAAVVQFPGFKIPWAPVIQSAEGIGKGVIKHAMEYAVGPPYVHFPDAQQLADSGGKFNAWMRGKVFILADEIKVDEKRHLVEVLKPLISEERIEVQGKGIDQEMEDTCAKWGFFTNYKDAVPVSRNGRRYAIFYSPIQTLDDLLARGMGDDYMKPLFNWLKADGKKHVAHWLHNYPIDRDSIPMRAPQTTSWAEAVSISRSPVERAIVEAIEGGVAGFKGGWVSEIAAMKHMRERQVVRGNLPPHAVRSVLEGMGYREVGRQIRPYFQEDVAVCGVLYSQSGAADVARYGTDQGYE